MNLGLKSLEKLIKGQKRPKKAKKGQTCQQRPLKAKTSKTFHFITYQWKVIHKLEWKIRKSDFLKVGIFHFQYIKFLNYILSKKLRFLRNSGKTTNSAYSLISIFLETNEFSSLYFPQLK